MRITLTQLVLAVILAGIARAESGSAQTILDRSVSLVAENISVAEALNEIEKHAAVKFVYSKNFLKMDKKVSLRANQERLSAVLEKLLSPLEIRYEVVNDQIVLRKIKAKPAETSAIIAPMPAEAEARAELTVSGQVTSDKGEALPGVNVVVKGTNTGTVSNAEGRFTLAVPDGGATLVFSFIGFITEEVPVNNRSMVDVVLAPNIESLSEVVVIGYGTQRKADVTSSVASVKAKDFVKGNVRDVGQLIQGKVAGLTVSSPSGDPTSNSQIVLRGSTTLLGANSNPLVLIDGIPGDLRTVAPEDIESIDILKDGSAAAIYGTRGTNGVIIITTKRAGGENTNTVEYNGSISTQTITRQLNLMTADDYRDQIAAGTRDASWDLGSSTDWMKEITQTPVSHVHNLTFRGGNSTTNYLANVNYRSFEGIFKKSNNRTFTARADINHNMFNDKLRINIGLLNSNNQFTTTGDGFSFNGYTYRQALIRNPTAPIRDEAGNWHEQASIFNYENPLARLYESDGRNSAQNTRLSTAILFNPLEGLQLKALISYNRFDQTRGYSETKRHISTLRDNRNGFASTGSADSVSRLVELTAEYSKAVAKHRFSVLGGYSYQDNTYQDQWMQNWNFPTDIFGYSNIGSGKALLEGLAPISSLQRKTNLIGFFSRATYSFNDKYLLMANLRHEAASQLYGARKPWGTFPAVSAGWRISSEPFLANLNLFSDLKLRAGYGVTGTQPSNLFLGVALLGYNRYIYSNGDWIQTLSPTQNPNPNLRWEEKHETNIGLDFSLLSDRIGGSVDYYIRRIDGLLYDYAVPSPPNLYPTTRANVGKMENKGLEVLLNVVPLRTNDFEWTSSFNFSTNSNKLISLSNETYTTTSDYFTPGSTGEPIQTFTHRVKIGDRIGDFYGFKVVDIDETGKWVYEGKNGERVDYNSFQHSFEDKKVLGNGLPKYYAGWNNSFRYKQFDLNVTMRGAFGYQILNYQRMYFENPTLPQYNQLKSASDNVFGKAVLSAPLEFNSYYVEDGDFWKIDNITLGYNLGKSGIKFLQSARVYVATLNTLTITKYKGIDPEVDRLGLAPGNDNRDKYPTARTYTFGINFSL